MLLHIFCSFTKEERQKYESVKYIKVLGFNQKGQAYINKIKKKLDILLITNITKDNIELQELELRCDQIYNVLTNKNDNLYSKKPILKP
jgi:hypothetical protein